METGPGPEIHTYHCLCSELAIAAVQPLEHFPKRVRDHTAICKVASDAPSSDEIVFFNSGISTSKPAVIRLEDGFEKIYPVKCDRCDTTLGYRLDLAQSDETQNGVKADVVYLLGGALTTTENMEAAGR